MNYFNTASKGIKLVEKAFMIIVVVSIIFRYTLDYNAAVNLLVAGFLLGLLYFPFGFYFLGKPLITSVPFGFVYALGVVALLLGVLKVHNYQYPLFTIFLIFIGIATFLYTKLKSGAYTMEYIYAQFFRLIFITVLNLVVLVFRF
ncbi:MAG: hypothetical protein ACHQF4_06520 [Sphingobacteriales bacterium]